MKLLKLFSYSFLLFAAFSFSQCKKKSTNPIDELPPETQTGANTFGCLVDGKALTPGGNSISGPIKGAIYQYIISGTPSGYTFAVSGTDKRNTENITNVGFGFDSVKMSVGTFPLRERKNGQGGGGVRFYTKNNPYGDIYDTNELTTGEITLKRFDSLNQIVSGTFWFDALNYAGQKVEIREGRFDMPYTR